MKKQMHSRSCVKVFMAVVWLCMVLMGMQASAAPFKRVQVGVLNANRRTKVGKYYFWGDFKDNSDTSKYYIFVGKSKTGKGKALASVDSGTSRQEVIMTDGKTVVYPYYHSGKFKTTLYSIRVDGSKKTKYNTINDYVYMMKQSGSKCYYYMDRDSNQALYCLDLNTGKVKTLAKCKSGYARAIDSSDHLFFVDNGTSKIKVKVINGKTAKTIKTRSIDRKAVNSIFAPLVTSKYFYLAVTNTKKTKATIYRMSVKGGKLKKYAVIAPEKSTITSVSLLNDSYCGYTTGNEKYYKYTFKTKKRVKISLDELLRLQTADLYSY